MRRIAIALLATTVIAAPAFAASDNQQQPKTHQMQSNDQNQANTPQNASNQTNGRMDQNGSNQNNEQMGQNSQPISPQKLSREEIRQIQQALDNDGFGAGRVDGRWGRETEGAVKKFQQSKQIQANGKLDRQTIADLGLDPSKFSQSGEQQK